MAGLEKKDLPSSDAASGDVDADADDGRDQDAGEDSLPDDSGEIDEDGADPDDGDPPSDADAEDAEDVEEDADEEEAASLVCFRDDFDAADLGAGWSFIDHLGDCSYSLSESPGYLKISVPSGVNHDCWTARNDCPRMVRAVENSMEMTFEVRMDVSVEPSDVTSFGLWVGQDDSHFLRFEIYRANGHAFVKAFSVFWPAGAEELSYGIGSTMGATNYLRINKHEGTYELLFSLDGIVWNDVGVVLMPELNFTTAGLFVINYGEDPEPAPAASGFFQYYEQCQVE